MTDNDQKYYAKIEKAMLGWDVWVHREGERFSVPGGVYWALTRRGAERRARHGFRKAAARAVAPEAPSYEYRERA